MNDSNDPNCMVEPTRSAVLAWPAAGGGAFTPPSVCRSTAKQAQLRIDNGCPDVYDSPASSCRVPTAIPGTSKHERGEAIDIQGDKVLARTLAPRFGLALTVRGEDWHFEVVDQAVALRYSNGVATVPTGTTATGTASVTAGSSDKLAAARAVGALLAKLADPATWRRVGIIAAGVLLALAGAALISQGVLPTSVSDLVPMVK